MKEPTNWEARIGRRVRLRDLHVLLTVVQHGSMVKAAAQLNVSQPAISDAIATLEAALGVRLLERSRKGVEPTTYGVVLMKYGLMAIDDLRQGVREIEFLSDPTAGELRIACTDTIANGSLVPIIQQFGEQYPRVRIHLVQLETPLFDFSELEQREVDLIIVRLDPKTSASISSAVNVEELFVDRYCVVAKRRSPLARRNQVEPADLVNERWIMPPADIAPGSTTIPTYIQEIFLGAGLPPPRSTVTTFSASLRAAMVASGQYISALPESVVRLHASNISELRIAWPMPSWPVTVVTLKNRALNPAARLFIECARGIVKSFAGQLRPSKSKSKI